MGDREGKVEVELQDKRRDEKVLTREACSLREGTRMVGGREDEGRKWGIGNREGEMETEQGNEGR